MYIIFMYYFTNLYYYKVYLYKKNYYLFVQDTMDTIMTSRIAQFILESEITLICKL